MEATRLIGLDWGTSSLRGYRIASGGRVLERREGPHGVLAIEDGDFEGTLLRFVGDWLGAEPAVSLLASGMVGSRQGWVEVPYVDCPAGLAEIASGLVVIRMRNGRPIHLVPGLVSRSPVDAPDVVRGEETQILGAVVDGARDGLFVLPGTHGKWARVEGGRVVRFATFLTGELYAALRGHTILARGMAGEAFDGAAFEAGVRVGHAAEGPTGGLLHRLFGVRTRGLFGELAPEAAPSFLSGLLVGAEIREAAAIWGPPTDVVLVGGRRLVARYARALAVLSCPAATRPEETVARGHWCIAEQAGLVAA